MESDEGEPKQNIINEHLQLLAELGETLPGLVTESIL